MDSGSNATLLWAERRSPDWSRVRRQPRHCCHQQPASATLLAAQLWDLSADICKLPRQPRLVQRPR